jgi:hypothetical protein
MEIMLMLALCIPKIKGQSMKNHYILPGPGARVCVGV